MESLCSVKAIQPLIWAFNMGDKLKCMPFYWNETEYGIGRLGSLKEDKIIYYTYQFLTRIHLFRNCIVPFYIIFKFKQDSTVQLPDIILGIFFICIHIMSVVGHSMFLFHKEAAELALNEMFHILQKTGEF